MAWSISITQEGWDEIREELEKWSDEALIDALTDDLLEALDDSTHITTDLLKEQIIGACMEWLKEMPHDFLVNRAFEMIEANNTCDNGGWAYWIDRKGYHKVELGYGSKYQHS
jgi:hypothetical protein